MKTLLAEDDKSLAAALAEILRENGWETDVVGDGESALEYAESGLYDVVILDVMMPGRDGFEVVSELRRRKNAVPVIMLTAKGAVADKVQGFDAGADDYMTKPFAPVELLAHLRALTRRKGEVVFETIECGDITLNLEGSDLSCGNETIHLRMKEFLILQILMENEGRVIGKDTLLDRVWGSGTEADVNNVEAHVSFLRKKLKFLGSRMRIETVPKVGYKLVEAEDDSSREAGQ